MINTPESYRDAGLKAGTAMRHRDISCYQSHIRWFREASRLESPSEREDARRFFDEGYREGNPPPPTCLA
jgi:hypothetical protein